MADDYPGIVLSYVILASCLTFQGFGQKPQDQEAPGFFQASSRSLIESSRLLAGVIGHRCRAEYMPGRLIETEPIAALGLFVPISPPKEGSWELLAQEPSGQTGCLCLSPVIFSPAEETA